MQKGDEASPSIILAGQALSVKMLITLELHGIFGSKFVKKGDEASPTIILASRALLVKMLITLEPRGAFCSNFEYLCILTLSSHWYTKRRRGFIDHRASFWPIELF